MWGREAIITVVAAIHGPTGVFMGADSLASNADVRVDSSTPKVFRCRNFLVGYAGSWAVGQVLYDIVHDEPGITIKKFVKNYEAPKGDDWEVLFADYTGVFEYQPGGGLIKMRVRGGYSYGVIGSGTGPALGSLYSWHDGPEALKSALCAAEAHTNHVRRPFKVVSL